MTTTQAATIVITLKDNPDAEPILVECSTPMSISDWEILRNLFPLVMSRFTN